LKPKFDFVDSELEKIKKNHLYRKLRDVKVQGSIITVKGKKLVNLCSNDYLGMPATPMPINQMQSSSRLVSGNDEEYKILEKKLARHKSQQDSLIYPTGYMANLGAVCAIAKKGDLILSDELNHASIIDACKLSGAKISIYKHNDMQDLQSKLKQKSANKFVITEGIFSMDGDFSKIKEITEVAQTKNAIVILDDAHGDFAVGKDGKGTANLFGVSKRIDVYVSSLSKALGSFGGYVASQKNVIDMNVNKSKSFIYTSALPSFLVNYSLDRLEQDRCIHQKKLYENTKTILKGLWQIGYKINSKTHIIPITIGDEKTALNFGKYIHQKGVFAQPIRFPTVPKNKARIRISVTSWLSKKDIEYSLEVFEKAHSKFLK
jgi:glycine C-acetyltransferase